MTREEARKRIYEICTRIPTDLESITDKGYELLDRTEAGIRKEYEEAGVTDFSKIDTWQIALFETSNSLSALLTLNRQ